MAMAALLLLLHSSIAPAPQCPVLCWLAACEAECTLRQRRLLEGDAQRLGTCCVTCGTALLHVLLNLRHRQTTSYTTCSQRGALICNTSRQMSRNFYSEGGVDLLPPVSRCTRSGPHAWMYGDTTTRKPRHQSRMDYSAKQRGNQCCRDCFWVDEHSLLLHLPKVPATYACS